MSLGLDPLSGLGEIYLELTSWWSVLSEAVGIMISSINNVMFYVLCRWCSVFGVCLGVALVDCDVDCDAL